MYAVSAENLSKTYASGKKAIENLNFSIEKGSIFGILGPNGAGKTTTIKLLNGILTPSYGGCSVFNIDPQNEPDKMHLIAGVVTEHAQMYDELTGLENLVFYSNVFGINKHDGTIEARALLEKLNLIKFQNQKLATYSTGMRQRLSLARAMIHKPKILFLDEPTSGLDPESALQVNKWIEELSVNDGVTIFLCTHQLRYAQEICTNYTLIDNGQMLAIGTLQELRQKVCLNMDVCIECGNILEDMQSNEKENSNIVRSVQSKKEVALLVKELVEKGVDIYSVVTNEPSLEDIYFDLIQKRNGD